MEEEKESDDGINIDDDYIEISRDETRETADFEYVMLA